LGAKDYFLILNIGTPNTEKCGKTSLITKLFSIKEEFIGEAHLSNILNIYTKIKLNKMGNFILADFNGVVLDKLNQNVAEIIQRYARCASLLIIHTKEQDIK
jgi:hypothetical protein